MQDEMLADCLDEVLLAWRAGQPLDLTSLRTRFPSLAEDPLLLEFFVKLCAFTDDWRTAPPDLSATLDSQSDTPADPPTATEPPPLLIGRYRILDRVASGGMGTVYRAYDPTLGRKVALKVPHLDPDHPRYDELAEQFVQEARLAAAVDHPNVCAVYDAGRHEGTPYVVMALIDGITLSARLKTQPRFEDPTAAVDLIRRVAEGLHAAHQRKIVHRDIKPGNILLRLSDGQPVLADFGLARVAQEGAFVTRPGVVAGTVAYMAPEQAAGDAARIGPASDVYGLGAVLYQMVTGRLPHQGDAATILTKLQSADVPAPIQLRPDLDPRIDALIRRSLARDTTSRYRDAGELAAALRSISSPASDTPETVTYSVPAPTPRPRRSRWLVAGVVLTLVLTGMTLGIFRNHLISAPTPPLDGELTVRVWTDPKLTEPNARPKVGIAVDDRSREALPIRNIDLVHIEVTLNRPAYIYLFWFPGEGGPPSPLYPWNPHPNQGFEMTPEQKPVREVHSPDRLDDGWGIKGPSGLETAVLLAKDKALTSKELADLQHEIGTLPATPLGTDLRECAWLWRESTEVGGAWTHRGTNRGIDTTDSRKLVDGPVFALLKRMQPRFDLVKAVRFAHVGDDLGSKPKAPGGAP